MGMQNFIVEFKICDLKLIFTQNHGSIVPFYNCPCYILFFIQLPNILMHLTLCLLKFISKLLSWRNLNNKCSLVKQAYRIIKKISRSMWATGMEY